MDAVKPTWDSAMPAKLSKAEAIRIVRELATDADRVVPVQHARKRMKERGITITQIIRVVRAGFIDGEPWLDEHGNWRVTMIGNPAGAQVTVGVAIEWRTRLLVITVF